MKIYYGAGHEQFPPRELLRHAQLAAEVGFDGVACSDHFQPWWEPGESGHAWPWLGALGASTQDIALGTAVTPAVRRYHPALVAQAFATLEDLFPGRVFLGYGSGESLNESPFGYDWPSGDEQLELMDEALDMIRRLWNGETISTGSKHFPTKDAKLHSRPDRPPPLYISAFHEGAAKVAAEYGDGLWTLGDPESVPGLIETYRGAGGRGEIILQALVSWGEPTRPRSKAPASGRGRNRPSTTWTTGTTPSACTSTRRRRSPTRNTARARSSPPIRPSTFAGSSSWSSSARRRSR